MAKSRKRSAAGKRNYQKGGGFYEYNMKRKKSAGKKKKSHGKKKKGHGQKKRKSHGKTHHTKKRGYGAAGALARNRATQAKKHQFDLIVKKAVAKGYDEKMAKNMAKEGMRAYAARERKAHAATAAARHKADRELKKAQKAAKAAAKKAAEEYKKAAPERIAAAMEQAARHRYV
jgi:hypothetical protein